MCVTKARQTSFTDMFSNLLYRRSIKDRRSELHTQLLTGPTQNGLVDLTQVHTTRYTQRVQYHVHRRSICEEWHILRSYNLRNDTFITMPSRHLITHLQLPLYSEINFGELQYTSRQFITNADIELLAFVTAQLFVVLDAVVVQQDVDRFIGLGIPCPAQRVHVQVIDAAQIFSRELGAFADLYFTKVVVHPGRHMLF